MAKFKQLVIYLWLFALYPIFYLYSNNLSLVRDEEVLEACGAALLITTLVVLAFWLVIRNFQRAALMTLLVQVAFFTYGHLYNLVGTDHSLLRQLLPVLMGGLTLAGCIAIARTKMRAEAMTPYLNVIVAVLLLLPTWQIIEYWVNDTTAANGLAIINAVDIELHDEPKLKNDADHPDVYYIILDGYSSNKHLLEAFGYDNSAFTNALEERGFFVADESRSNYGTTLLSLASSLNMRYIDQGDRAASDGKNIPQTLYLRSIIADSRVAKEFINRGYTYNFMLSGFSVPSTIADHNIDFQPNEVVQFSGNDFLISNGDRDWYFKQAFWPMYLETTALRSFAHKVETQEEGRPYTWDSPERVLATLDKVHELPLMEEATFSFIHVLKPHEPISFDAEGNIITVDMASIDRETRTKLFFEELGYLNQRVLAMIDDILAHSSIPPIIVIQGDHGTDLGNPWDVDGHWSHYEILNAYLLPDDMKPVATISPANSFRFILAEYFGADYDLLPNKRFNIPRGFSDLFVFVEVADDGRINADLGDEVVRIYPDTDANGDLILNVYAVGGDGTTDSLIMTVTTADVKPYADAPPEQNVTLKSTDNVLFSVLTTGELQFNITSETGDRSWVVILDGLAPEVVYGDGSD